MENIKKIIPKSYNTITVQTFFLNVQWKKKQYIYIKKNTFQPNKF